MFIQRDLYPAFRDQYYEIPSAIQTEYINFHNPGKSLSRTIGTK